MRVSAAARYSVRFLDPVQGHDKGCSGENVEFVGVAA